MASNDQAIESAKTFVNQLHTGDFQSATGAFDATMAAAMPTEALKAGWEQVVAQAGAYEETLGAEASDQDGYTVVIVKLKFANAMVGCRLAFDGEGRVAGMGFQPV